MKQEENYTFEKVWQILIELGERQKESDRILIEKFATTEKLIKENGCYNQSNKQANLRYKSVALIFLVKFMKNIILISAIYIAFTNFCFSQEKQEEIKKAESRIGGTAGLQI